MNCPRCGSKEEPRVRQSNKDGRWQDTCRCQHCRAVTDLLPLPTPEDTNYDVRMTVRGEPPAIYAGEAEAANG